MRIGFIGAGIVARTIPKRVLAVGRFSRVIGPSPLARFTGLNRT